MGVVPAVPNFEIAKIMLEEMQFWKCTSCRYDPDWLKWQHQWQCIMKDTHYNQSSTTKNICMRFFLSFNYSGPLFIDLASWLKERVFPFERWRRQIESSQLPNLPNIWAWHCLSSSTLSLFLVFLPSWLLRRRTFLISCKPRRWCVKTKSFPIESGKAGFIRKARRSNYIRSAL